MAVPSPTTVFVWRTSDSSHTVTWLADPTARFEMQRSRLSQAGQGWVTVARPGVGVRSWTDPTSMPNDRLAWRVRAVTNQGASEWRQADPVLVWTTPAAPTDVTAARQGADFVVSWVRNARDAHHVGMQMQTSADTGQSWSGWSDLAGHVNLPPTTTSRTITGLPGTATYRWRVVAAVVTPATLYGISVASEPLVPLVAPKAPTLLAPVGVTSAVVPGAFEWQHNPNDTTAQTAYELRYALSSDGGQSWPEWTTLSGSSAHKNAVALGVGEARWQVRTKGQHADWSPWSAIGQFTLAQPPAVTIEVPADGATQITNLARWDWVFDDAQGAEQAAWRAELLDASGGVLEVRTGSAPTTRATAFSRRLDNQTKYGFRLVVTSGTGLASEPATSWVTTAFVPPKTPAIEAAWEDTGAVLLAITNDSGVPGEQDRPAAVSNRVERSLNGGVTWTEIAAELSVDAGVEDWFAPLNTPILYRASAVSALGVETVSEVAEIVASSQFVWLRTAGGVQLRLQLDLSIDLNAGHGLVLEQYLGDTKPTAHFGVELPVEIAIKGTLVEGFGLGDDYRQLLRTHVHYRDPVGRAFWAVLQAGGIGLGQSNSRVAAFSATVIEVEYEPV